MERSQGWNLGSHEYSRMTQEMQFFDTLNRFAKSFCKTPVACAALIMSTLSQVSFAVGPFSPALKAPLSQRCLPFEMQSSTLSCIVPRNKWLGLTHLPLSHRCSTHNPSGMAPKASTQDTLWDFNIAGPIPNDPLPELLNAPIQFQQVSDLHTLSQNLLAKYSSFAIEGLIGAFFPGRLNEDSMCLRISFLARLLPYRGSGLATLIISDSKSYINTKEAWEDLKEPT